MPSKVQIKILVVCVLLIVAGVLLAKGRTVSIKDLLSTFSYVVSGVWFILFLWDRWLWRLPIFRLVSKRPDLRGTWKGELQSDYSDPGTTEKRSAIEVYLVIRQTNSTIDVRLFSGESSSLSLSGSVIADGADVNKLVVTYRNEPQLSKRGQSPISYGGMMLNVRGDEVYQLDGEYWTDRLTRGEIKFTARSKKVCHDFGQAGKVVYQSLNASHQSATAG